MDLPQDLLNAHDYDVCWLSFIFSQLFSLDLSTRLWIIYRWGTTTAWWEMHSSSPKFVKKLGLLSYSFIISQRWEKKPSKLHIFMCEFRPPCANSTSMGAQSGGKKGKKLKIIFIVMIAWVCLHNCKALLLTSINRTGQDIMAYYCLQRKALHLGFPVFLCCWISYHVTGSLTRQTLVRSNDLILSAVLFYTLMCRCWSVLEKA